MPNSLYTSSNDVENGYIYKELISRIDMLEKKYEGLNNLLINLSDGTISVSELSDLLRAINEKASLSLVKNHIEDQERHLNDVKRMEWDEKYEVPPTGIPESDLSKEIRDKLNNSASQGYIKYETLIGNGIDDTYIVTHNLHSDIVNVTVKDTVDNDVVITNIITLDDDNIELSFSMIPANEQFQVLVLR